MFLKLLPVRKWLKQIDVLFDLTNNQIEKNNIYINKQTNYVLVSSLFDSLFVHVAYFLLKKGKVCNMNNDNKISASGLKWEQISFLLSTFYWIDTPLLCYFLQKCDSCDNSHTGCDLPRTGNISSRILKKCFLANVCIACRLVTVCICVCEFN